MVRAGVTVVVAVLLMTACGGDDGSSNSGGGPDEVSIVLSFLMDGNKAPFALGKEKGFFEEEGIDLTIEEGNGSTDAVKLVANGRFDFGDAAATATAIGVDKGVPVKMVANHQPRGQHVILVREDSGIESLTDLEGRSLLMGQDEAISLLESVLEAAGADPSEIDIKQVDGEQRNGLFLQNQGDAMWSPFESVASLQEADPDLELRAFPFAEFGFNTMNQGLITNTTTLEENPDLVRRMVAAYTKSYIYAASHEEELIDVVSELYPEAKPEVLDVEFDIAFALVATENTAGHPFGYMAAEDWESTTDILRQTELIETETELDDFYTNEFIGDWEPLEPQGEFEAVLGGL